MEHFNALVVFSLSLINYCLPNEYDWRCTDEFCQKFDCPLLPKECSNKSLSFVMPDTGPCNCCDHCFLFKDEGENCPRTTANLRLPEFICKPGYKCNSQGKCEKMPKADPQFFPNYVCRNGMCTCAVLIKDEIKPIFGQFYESTLNVSQVQCECAVVAYKAMSQDLRGLPFEGINQPSARCLSNGQFDPLQCIDDKCGCVEQDTGTPDEHGFKYFIKDLETNHPECFDRNRHKKGEYYTECEKRRNLILQERNEGIWTKTNLINFKRISCTPDGEFAKP